MTLLKLLLSFALVFFTLQTAQAQESNRDLERFRESSEHSIGKMLRERHGQRGKPEIRKLRRFMEFMRAYNESLKDPYHALGLAALGIREFYREDGNWKQAVKEIESFLDGTSNQEARNILLFQIQQTYQEAKQGEQALETARRIAKENLALIKKDRTE